MDRATTSERATAEQMSGTGTTLLLAGADDDECEACAELMTTDPPGNQLHVTYTQTADGRYRDWRRHVRQAADVNIVAIGDMTRSTQNSSGNSLQPIACVGEPTDLTGAGMKITRRLAAWTDGSAPIAVCFDSVSVLLQHVDLRRAYQFLHVLTNKFHGAGAQGHFHMDPDKHDQRTVDQIASLCDRIVDVDGDEWTGRTRR